MSIDGLWTTEVFGLWGWEHRGVLVLRNGSVLGGGDNHHSVGNYTINGDEVNASLEIRYHGTPRTMFGSREQEFTLELRGHRKNDQITGEMHRSDRPDLQLEFRCTLRASLS